MRDQDNVTVFPNPADEVIHLEWAGSTKAEVRVWSATGILVLNNESASGETEIQIAAWEAGVYVVEVRSADQVWWEKVVVE